MGVVYKAEDLKLSRTVALKFLRHALRATEIERTRLLQEARAAALLNHPAICTIYDIQDHEGQPFIVMEFVEGTTLREIVPAKTTQEAISYAIQIAEGLEEAHGKGIVHRDIKAENILVTPKRQAKVMDFGLAKLKGSVGLTQTSSTAGTLAYMAPEQIQGGEIDARADIFSFGIVLYELLTGHLPFRGDHQAALVYSITNEEPEPLQQYIPDAPSELLHVINRALEKNPEERYQSVHEMLIDLRRIRKDSPQAARPSPVRQIDRTAGAAPTAGLRRLSRKTLWTLAGFVVVLASLIAWLSYQRDGGITETARERSVAVMYFENRTDERDLDKILVDMLITNLARNKDISVVSGQRLYDILKSLGKEDADVIDKSTATEAAKRAAVETMLLGTIWKVGGTLSVTGQLLDVETGAVINSDRIDISKAEEVFSVADRLTARVNEWLAGSQAEVLRIADATTGSFDAYRYYEQGIRRYYRFEMGEAQQYLIKATQLDSTFAMAHYNLSRIRGYFQVFSSLPGRTFARARESAAAAVRHSGSLPPKEQNLIAAWSAFLRRDYTSSERLLASLRSRYPDDRNVLGALELNEVMHGRLTEAIAIGEKRVEMDRSHASSYNTLSYWYAAAGEHDKACATIQTYIALLPDAVNAYDSGSEIFMKAGRFAEALRIAQEGIACLPQWSESYQLQAEAYLLMNDAVKARERIDVLAQTDTGRRDAADLLRATTYCFEGRMHEGLDILRQLRQRARSANDTTTELTVQLRLAKVLLEQERHREALKQLDAMRTLVRADRQHGSSGWLLLIDYIAGLCHVSAGNLAEAERCAAAIRTLAERTLGDAHFLFYSDGLESEIHLAGGQTRAALIALDRIFPFVRSRFPRIRILDARVAMALGERKNAFTAYHGFRNAVWAENSGQGGDFCDFWLEQSKLDYYIGLMHEQFRETPQALEAYNNALVRWSRADPDFPPAVDARRRRGKLPG